MSDKACASGSYYNCLGLDGEWFTSSGAQSNSAHNPALGRVTTILRQQVSDDGPVPDNHSFIFYLFAQDLHYLVGLLVYYHSIYIGTPDETP